VTRRRRLRRSTALAVFLAAMLTPSAANADQRVLRLVSDGPSPTDPNIPAYYGNEATDGSVAIFNTRERLLASDTDAEFDAFARRPTGALEHLTDPPFTPDGAFDAVVELVSADASRLVIQTAENLRPSDADADTDDLYLRTPAGLLHVTDNLTGADANGAKVRARYLSPDGRRVYFETDEKLVATDTDTAFDVYEYGPGADCGT
jgi:hypothetical protein